MEGSVAFCQKHDPLKEMYSTSVLGLHAINLMPGLDANFAKMVSDGSKPVTEHIKDCLIDPVMPIADQLIYKKAHDDLVKFAEEHLVEEDSKAEFSKEVEALDWQKTSLNSYFQNLLAIVKKHSSKQDEMALELRLTNHLISYSLLDKDYAILTSSAVKVFHTDWDAGDDEEDFCFFLNPGTKEIVFGKIDSKMDLLVMYDPGKWIKDRTWVIYEETIKDVKMDKHIN